MNGARCRYTKYASQRAADWMVRWFLKHRKIGLKKVDREQLASYLCPRCGWWHVGRDRYKKGA